MRGDARPGHVNRNDKSLRREAKCSPKCANDRDRSQSLFQAIGLAIRRTKGKSVTLPGAAAHAVTILGSWSVCGVARNWRLYSKRRTLRKVHANIGQICAALMTHQDVGDGEVLPELLDQIPVDTPIGVVGGDGAYDTRQCHAAIAARGATPSIPPRDRAAP